MMFLDAFTSHTGAACADVDVVKGAVANAESNTNPNRIERSEVLNPYEYSGRIQTFSGRKAQRIWSIGGLDYESIRIGTQAGRQLLAIGCPANRAASQSIAVELICTVWPCPANSCTSISSPSAQPCRTPSAVQAAFRIGSTSP